MTQEQRKVFICEATDTDGTKHIIEMYRIYYRKRQGVATEHITEDKVHNRHTMQHVTDLEME